MKKYLLLPLLFCLYSVSFRHTYNGKPDKDNMVAWSFKMVPRKIPCIIWFLLLTPLIILFVGLAGWWALVKEKSSFKPEGWASYKLYVGPDEKPSKFKAYLKY